VHRDAEPAVGPRREGERSVVCLGDALDDREAEADARVVFVDALRAALKRPGQRRDELRGEGAAGVLDGERRAVGPHACRHPDAAAVGQVVDDRVVHEVRRQLQQERVGADRPGCIAAGLDADGAVLRERKKRLGGFFGD
jgi:hypothetical protein